MYNPQLETFLCVAESGSFNKAAERMYISPPAVIKQINLLESSLDLQLFIRTHRGLVLTEAGKSLYQDTKYIIQYCKDSVTRARNAMQESTNVIRIGTSPMTPAQVLVDLWPRLQKRTDLLRGIGPPPTGRQGTPDGPGSVWRKFNADSPGLEQLCGYAAGRYLEKPSPDSYCRF